MKPISVKSPTDMTSQTIAGRICRGSTTFMRMLLFFQLGKPLLSFHIAFSALIGALLALPVLDRQAGSLFLGVFFLASCGAVTNNMQDTFYDRAFIRTRNRALPAGTVKRTKAFQLALIYGILAIFFLGLLVRDTLPLLIGIVGLTLYNLVYTPLKKKTMHALFPGILCGMLPPLIGWTGHGGSNFSAQIIAFSCCIGIWQIPHTLSIQWQNRSSLLDSSWPNILKGMPLPLFSSAMVFWTNAYAISLATLPLFGLTHSLRSALLLIGIAFAGQNICLREVRKCAHSQNNPAFLPLRRYLSISLAMVLVILFITHQTHFFAD